MQCTSARPSRPPSGPAPRASPSWVRVGRARGARALWATWRSIPEGSFRGLLLGKAPGIVPQGSSLGRSVSVTPGPGNQKAMPPACDLVQPQCVYPARKQIRLPEAHVFDQRTFSAASGPWARQWRQGSLGHIFESLPSGLTSLGVLTAQVATSPSDLPGAGRAP